MKTKIGSLFLFLFLTSGAGCGKKEFFTDYIPLSMGSVWVFEDNDGSMAEIEITDDSLTAYRDTIFKLFFLGNNIDFMKTPNTLSWRFTKRYLIEDREVVLEDRYYPFFEMPFIEGRTRHIVYENHDSYSGAYFKRVYDYTYGMEHERVRVDITSDVLYVYNNDSVNDVSSYTFFLSPDTGFVKIIYTLNGKVHNLKLKEYKKGE